MIHIFIVNPHAGMKTFADDLRSKLAGIEGLNYFVFNTRYAGYERDIIKKIQYIFEHEKLRFYCCGGSGTMKNLLDGFESFDNVEIAFFPCGLSNDFLKVFEDEEVAFRKIENLINGEVIDVDYLQTNYGRALNSISTGFEEKFFSKLDIYRIFNVFGSNMPYTISVIYALIMRKIRAFEIQTDDKNFSGPYSELFFGNGYVMGGNLYFDSSADITDGKLVYCLMKKYSYIKTFVQMSYLVKRELTKLRKTSDYGYTKKLSIRAKNGQPFVVSMDGNKVYCKDTLEIEVIQKGLHLVVPGKKGGANHEA